MCGDSARPDFGQILRHSRCVYEKWLSERSALSDISHMQEWGQWDCDNRSPLFFVYSMDARCERRPSTDWTCVGLARTAQNGFVIYEALVAIRTRLASWPAVQSPFVLEGRCKADRCNTGGLGQDATSSRWYSRVSTPCCPALIERWLFFYSSLSCTSERNRTWAISR
jgi:hypothetical protein